MPSSGCLQGRTMVIVKLLLLILASTVLSGVIVNAAAAAAAIEESDKIIVDVENGGKCIDSDPKNCPYWAATNQCITNKAYMNINCKLSCNRCNIVRVQNHNEMNSYIANKKKELEYKRSERKKLKESLTILASAAENNEEITTTTTTTAKTTITGELLQQEELNNDDDTTTVGSIDDDDDHNKNNIDSKNSASTSATTAAEVGQQDVEVNANVEEEEHQQETIVVSSGGTTNSTTTTTKTETKSTSTSIIEKKKKNIIIDADTGLECIDQDEKNCPYWSITGECKKNRTWMHTNCKKSCNRCHVVRVNTQNDINTIISRKNKEAKEKHNLQRKKLDSLRILSSSSSQGEL